MSKITIIEGNSNDKDNVRNFMVKGEPGNDGVSPTATVTRGTDKATINITDATGTTSSDVYDGISPTVTAEKEDKTTTITITDKNGTRTAEIEDGVDLTGGVPTNGVIAFDGESTDIPDGYEVSSSSIATLTDEYSTSNSVGYTANFINEYVGEQVSDVYSTTETKTNKYWIDGKPIYRKVFSTGAVSTTNTDFFISMGMNITDISQIVKIDGFFNFSIGTIPANFHNENNTSYDVLTYYNTQQTVARIGVRNNVAITSGYIILEYTKAD